MGDKRFDYTIEVERDGTALAEGRPGSSHEITWTPEHLLLESLARCTLHSLRFHADRCDVTVAGRASVTAGVTRPPGEPRMRLVDISCRIDVDLDPLPGEETVQQLLADAEHDCFIGATLKPQVTYAWRVNGTAHQPAGLPSGLRDPKRAPRSDGTDADSPPDTGGLVCDRCGWPAPPGSSAEWSAWNPAGVSTEQLRDPIAGHVLICPTCRAEEQSPEELGGGD